MTYKVLKRLTANPVIRSALKPIQRDKPIYFSFILLVACYAAYRIATGSNHGAQLHILYFIIAVTTAIPGFLCAYFFYLIVKKEPRPLRAYARLLKLPVTQWQESLNFLLLLSAISFTLSIYTITKSAIPATVPFYLDPWLVKADLWLHFGYTPWTLTHALFSSPESTAAINFLYNIWLFFVWAFVITFMCWVSNDRLKQQAIICFCITWLISGGIGGTLLSSVGPCFYGKVYPSGDVFSGLLNLLHTQNDFLIAKSDDFFGIQALDTQDMLWNDYISNIDGLGSGISAMPSMHVSMAALMAMSTYSLNRRLGYIAWLYALVILIGSVHLGWHYAVDGYAALLITTIIWFTVKKLLTQYYQTCLPNSPNSAVPFKAIEKGS